MSTERTILVEGLFGDKVVGKQEFIKQWVDHAKQFMNISYTKEWCNRVADIMEEVGTAASNEFERCYTAQNQTAA